MHSPMSRSRKRGCPQKHAGARLTQEQQLVQALALIRPSPEEREMCADGISTSIRIVQAESDSDRGFDLSIDRVVEGLRTAEVALAHFEVEIAALSKRPSARLLRSVVDGEPIAGFPDSDQPPARDATLLGRIKKERERLEGLFDPDPEESSPRRRRSHAKALAAIWAFGLLDGFGSRKVGLTEGGTWHRLAAVLYGYVTVDMFSFDYLRDARRGMQRVPKHG
jgi:hypothetical protein